LCASTRQVLECTAFVNPAGALSTVVMNRSEDAQPFVLCLGGQQVRAELPPRSIATFVS